MKWFLFVFLFVILGVMTRARHIHPHGENTAHVVIDDEVLVPSEDDYEDIAGIRSVKPSRFVPINSALYFKDYEPCEEGYVRDLLGVCREIWN